MWLLLILSFLVGLLGGAAGLAGVVVYSLGIFTSKIDSKSLQLASDAASKTISFDHSSKECVIVNKTFNASNASERPTERQTEKQKERPTSASLQSLPSFPIGDSNSSNSSNSSIIHHHSSKSPSSPHFSLAPHSSDDESPIPSSSSSDPSSHGDKFSKAFLSSTGLKEESKQEISFPSQTTMDVPSSSNHTSSTTSTTSNPTWISSKPSLKSEKDSSSLFRAALHSEPFPRTPFIRDDAFAYKLSPPSTSSTSSTSSTLKENQISKTSSHSSDTPSSSLQSSSTSRKLSIAEVPMSLRSKEKAAKLLGLFDDTSSSKAPSSSRTSSSIQSLDILSESDSIVFHPHSSSRRSIHSPSHTSSSSLFDASQYTSSEEVGITMSGRAMLTSSGKAGDLISSSFSKNLVPLAPLSMDLASISKGKIGLQSTSGKKKSLSSTSQQNPIYSSESSDTSDKRRRMTASESKNPTQAESERLGTKTLKSGIGRPLDTSITSSAPSAMMSHPGSSHKVGIVGSGMAGEGEIGSHSKLSSPALQSTSPRLISPGSHSRIAEEPMLPANERFQMPLKDQISSRKNLSAQTAVPVRIVRRETFIKDARETAMMEGQRRKIVIEMKETFGLREPSSSSESLALFVRISLCHQRFKTGYATRRSYDASENQSSSNCSSSSVHSSSGGSSSSLISSSVNSQVYGSIGSARGSMVSSQRPNSMNLSSIRSFDSSSSSGGLSPGLMTSRSQYQSSSLSDVGGVMQGAMIGGNVGLSQAPVGFGLGLGGLGRAKWSQNEMVVARVDNPHEDQILFEVLNRDRLLLGSARLLLHDLLKDAQKDVWLPLKGNVDQGKTKVNACGEIRVILTLLGWEDPIPLSKPRSGTNNATISSHTSSREIDPKNSKESKDSSLSSSHPSKKSSSSSKGKDHKKKNSSSRQQSHRHHHKSKRHQSSENHNSSSSSDSDSSGSHSSGSSYTSSSSSSYHGSSSSSSDTDDESSSLDTSSSLNLDSESSSSYIPTIRIPSIAENNTTTSGSTIGPNLQTQNLNSTSHHSNSSKLVSMVSESYDPKPSSRKRLSAVIMTPITAETSIGNFSTSNASISSTINNHGSSSSSNMTDRSIPSLNQRELEGHKGYQEPRLSLQIPNPSLHHQSISSSAPSSPLSSPRPIDPSSARSGSIGTYDREISGDFKKGSSSGSSMHQSHASSQSYASPQSQSYRHSIGYQYHGSGMPLVGGNGNSSVYSPHQSSKDDGSLTKRGNSLDLLESSVGGSESSEGSSKSGFIGLGDKIGPSGHSSGIVSSSSGKTYSANPMSQFTAVPIYEDVEEVMKGLKSISSGPYGLVGDIGLMEGGYKDVRVKVESDLGVRIEREVERGEKGEEEEENILDTSFSIPPPTFVVGMQGWVNIKLKFKQAKFENRWCVVDGNELRIYEDMYSKASLAILPLFKAKVWRLATKKHYIKVQLSKEGKNQWDSFQMKPLPIPGSPSSSHISPWFNQINHARKISNQYLSTIKTFNFSSLLQNQSLGHDSASTMTRDSFTTGTSNDSSGHDSFTPSSIISPSSSHLHHPTPSNPHNPLNSPPLPSSPHPSIPPSSKKASKDSFSKNTSPIPSNPSEPIKSPSQHHLPNQEQGEQGENDPSLQKGMVKSKSHQSLHSDPSLSSSPTPRIPIESLGSNHSKEMEMALERAGSSPRVQENVVSGVIGSSLLHSASSASSARKEASSRVGNTNDDDTSRGVNSKKRRNSESVPSVPSGQSVTSVTSVPSVQSEMVDSKGVGYGFRRLSVQEDHQNGGGGVGTLKSISEVGNGSSHDSMVVSSSEGKVSGSSLVSDHFTKSSEAPEASEAKSSSKSSSKSSEFVPLGIHMKTRDWRGVESEVDAKIGFKSKIASVGTVKDDVIVGVENMMVAVGVKREDEMLEYIRKEEEEERRAFVLANVTPLKRIPDHVKPYDAGFLNLVLWRLFRDMQTSELFANDVAEKIRSKIETVKLPPFLGNLRVLHMDYGKDFIKLESIKVSATEEADEVIIETDINYTGGLTVHLGLEFYINWPRPKAAVIPVTAAIKLKSLRGKLHILLPPSLNTKNSLCFVSPPNVEFDISIDIGKGQGRRVSSIPKLKHFLFSFARQAAFTALVHPSSILWHWPIPGRKVDVELRNHADSAKEKKPSKGRTQVLSRDSSDVIACKYVALEFFNNILNLYRYERLDQLFAPDCIIHGSSLIDIPLIGTDALLSWIVQIRHSIPDIRFFIDELSPSKNNISIQWTARGTFIHDLWDYPATSSELLLRGSFFFKVRDGNQLITEFFIFWSIGSIYGLI